MNGYSKGALHPNTPPAHIVKMEEITGGGSVKSFVMSQESAATSTLLTSSLMKIKVVLDDMKASIHAGELFIALIFGSEVKCIVGVSGIHKI